ncbi:MAG: aldose 1-epimerase family protein [Bacilli bacterium]|nr:aldose 1-epimerase family protein [Bacilli bacterium]
MLYTISNDILSLTINSVGAEIKSIKKDGIEYIHQDDPATWNRSAPFLFPAIGCFKNKVTYFNNQPYSLPKHGFVRDMEMNLTTQTDTSLVFEVTENGESLRYYPYNFIFRVTYALENDQVDIKLEVINTNNEEMPFNLGLHPAFKVPLFEGESFEDYQIFFNKKGSYELPTVDLSNGLVDWNNTSRIFNNLEVLPLNYDDYKNDALIFDNVPFNEITLHNPKNNYGIKLTFADFKTVGIWTPNHVNANFVCLEPWLGCADAPNTNGKFTEKKDIIKLAEKETFTTSYQIKILK